MSSTLASGSHFEVPNLSSERFRHPLHVSRSASPQAVSREGVVEAPRDDRASCHVPLNATM
jgi:hypothetical protein